MHLSYQEHVKIYSGLCNQMSKIAIAQSMDRAPSTIYREIARNCDEIGYLPANVAFHRQKQKRGQRKHKIDRNPKLREYIVAKLSLKWAPKVVASGWNKQDFGLNVTHETIYKWLYKSGNEELQKLLPRAKRKRGLVRKKLKKSKIPNRVGIENRPAEIASRMTGGHFEADLVFNKGSMSSNILTAIERKSRFTILLKNETKQSMEVIDGLEKRAQDLRIQSITFDNGSEFARHEILSKKHKISTYFCDPGKPWQKGSIEHFNGMLRRRIPFEVSPGDISQQLLDSVSYELNHMPRESLGFLTPCEVFNETFQSENSQCCVL